MADFKEMLQRTVGGAEKFLGLGPAPLEQLANFAYRVPSKDDVWKNSIAGNKVEVILTNPSNEPETVANLMASYRGWLQELYVIANDRAGTFISENLERSTIILDEEEIERNIESITAWIMRSLQNDEVLRPYLGSMDGFELPLEDRFLTIDIYFAIHPVSEKYAVVITWASLRGWLIDPKAPDSFYCAGEIESFVSRKQ